LLKTLEEPPAHAIFVLATTEVHKLLPTIVSRCQYFDFHHLSWEAIINHLKQIAAKEKISITDEAIAVIAESAEGSLRDALSVLDQIASLDAPKIDRQILEDLLGIVNIKVVRELTEAVLTQNVNKGIELINQAYYQGHDLNQLLKRWIAYIRELMMVSLGNDDLVSRSEDEKVAMRIQTQGIGHHVLINLLQRLADANNQYRVASVPQLALEMVIFRMIKSSEHNVPTLLLKPDLPVVKSAIKPQDSSTEVVTNHDLWLQVCRKISENNSALASLLKNSQVNVGDKQIVVELPSEFLKNVVKKTANLQIISTTLKSFGCNAEIDLIVSTTFSDKATEKVAEVFDIIQS